MARTHNNVEFHTDPLILQIESSHVWCLTLATSGRRCRRCRGCDWAASQVALAVVVCHFLLGSSETQAVPGYPFPLGSGHFLFMGVARTKPSFGLGPTGIIDVLRHSQGRGNLIGESDRRQIIVTSQFFCYLLAVASAKNVDVSPLKSCSLIKPLRTQFHKAAYFDFIVIKEIFYWP